MAENWPSTVPAPLIEGATMDAGTTIVTRKLQFGLTEVRRFGSGAPDIWTLSWALTLDQYTAFLNFYNTTLDSGVIPFVAAWLEDLGYTPPTNYQGMIMPYPKETLNIGNSGDFGYVNVECTVAIKVA